MKKKAIGQRGSWFATVDGEQLPCVHDKMMKNGLYHAGNCDDAAHVPLIAAIREKLRVVVRKSERTEDGIGWTSNGYVAVFEVADVDLTGSELTFRFVKRIWDLE